MTTTTHRVALRTVGLTKQFRGFTAVRSVDLEVALGGLHALVGPLPPEQIARKGVARSFQITSLFENMTPREHVELALQGGTPQGLRFWRSEKLLRRYRPDVDELLERVGLSAQADRPAGLLAYGQKRALELALVLALDPKVMLLDEPTAGMGIEDVDRTVELIRSISAGRTVVFVDHNMHVVGSLADRVTVLQQGEVLAEGSYDEVRRDARVVTAYLGEAHDA